MLLTITYRGGQATDLGYLLHKNPWRAQEFSMSFGKAYVFYPVAEAAQCTAALLLDINPIDLARGKAGTVGGGLFDYINDRPYVCSSFLSTAIAKVYSSALNGRCDERPELADAPLALEARLTMLPCRCDSGLVERIFTPLGYEVTTRRYPLDEQFPAWGESDYLDLTLRGRVRLRDLLNHLYVLVPVFDRQKHYWMSDDEVEKLLRHGGDWLPAHPEMQLITRRYFHKKRGLANQAIQRLLETAGIAPAAEEGEDAGEALQPEKRISLNDQRLDAVIRAVRDCGAERVADLGCGEGRLLSRLAAEPQITRLTGLDVSVFALERAERRLHLDRAAEYKRDKITLLQGALTYRDRRLEGYDAACVVEVLEHLDLERLPAFEQVIFQFAAPKTVIVTTPNVAYNINYGLPEKGGLRHPDHRFEWTRAEFRAWCASVCGRYGYTVTISGIGAADETVGAPTQMGVFTKCG